MGVRRRRRNLGRMRAHAAVCARAEVGANAAEGWGRAPRRPPPPLTPAAYENNVSSIKAALVRARRGSGASSARLDRAAPFAPPARGANCHVGGAGPCAARCLSAPCARARPPARPPRARAQLVNGIIGLVCFLGFLVCRSFMAQYQLRRHLASVTIRPPPMPTGAARFFSWIKPIFTTSDGAGGGRVPRGGGVGVVVGAAPRAARPQRRCKGSPALTLNHPPCVRRAVWVLHSAGLDGLGERARSAV